MSGRFLFDNTIFAIGLYLFVTCIISQIGAGNYGKEVFWGFAVFAIIGAWMVGYGIYRGFVAALKRVNLKSSSPYCGQAAKEKEDEARR